MWRPWPCSCLSRLWGSWCGGRPGGVGGARRAETRLRHICFGNAAQVERLIEAEQTRTPGISRAEAVTRAVLRYERDNH